MHSQISQQFRKGKSLIGGIVLIFILALTVTQAIQSQMAAAQSGPGRVDSPQVFASTGAINFQGELTDNSSGSVIPDGSYNMRFAIYDAATGGNKKWPLSNAYESQTGVAVSGGLFSAQLGVIDPITPGVFAGGGDRYLQLWVCTSAGTGCTTYDDLGRLPISSAAYAQNLAAGSSIEGSSNSLLSLYGSDSSGSVLMVSSSATTGNAAAVYGSSASGGGAGTSGSNSGGGYGVFGSSVSGPGVTGQSSTFAVSGVSTGSNGRGVYGYADAGSGTTYGVYGSANPGNNASVGVYGTANGGGVVGSAPFTGTVGIATDNAGGTGVFGQGETYGVHGMTSPYNINGIGVYGSAPMTGTVGVATTAGNAVGVYGAAPATVGGGNTGVYGRSNSNDNGRGVYGYAAAASGTTYGVYGQSDSPDGYGVYSQGNALVNGGLTVSGTIESNIGGFTFPDGTTQTTAATSARPGFVRTTLDSAGSFGTYTSIAMGVDGLPIMSYYDTDNNGSLKVAHCNDLACANVTKSTIISNILDLSSQDDNNRANTSIAIGADGLPVISYYAGAAHNSLDIAHCNNLLCTSATTSTVDGLGEQPSMAIGVNGFPLIAYFSSIFSLNDELKLAFCSNLACSSSTAVIVADIGISGILPYEAPSLAIGADGLPVMVFTDKNSNALKVAHCDNAGCTSVTLTTLVDLNTPGYFTGYGSSIAIGTDGFPVISYRERTTGDSLKVAHCSDVACTSASYSLIAGGGDDSSIAIGADGLPVISYLEFAQGDLMVTHCSNVACTSSTTITVDTTGLVGSFNDITNGGDGLPVIGYYDHTNDALKVVHCSNRFCVPYARP